MSPAPATREAEPQHVFLGDVQGCADEFDEMLDRLEDEFGSEFVLHCAGDLINRGPDNLRPLERMRELVEAGRAHYVLGNHEIALISMGLGLRSLGERDTLADVLGCAEVADWIDWLRGRPIADMGEVCGHAYVMIHAALHPDWSLADCAHVALRVGGRLAAGNLEAVREFLTESPADAGPGSDRDFLARLVSCRSVGEGDSWSSAEPAGSHAEPWHAAWTRRRHDYGVVYGHWARQGLHLAPGLRGLDSGCVHHGRGRDGFLTAWLPGSGEERAPARVFAVPDERLRQVRARKRYYPY